MIKETVEYVDYNGTKQTETLYFNLSQVDLARLVAKYASGKYSDLQEYVNAIIAENNQKAIIDLAEDVILSSYGEKTIDGKGFSKKNRENFEYSKAYAELFEMLFTDQDKLKAFINGVIETKN